MYLKTLSRKISWFLRMCRRSTCNDWRLFDPVHFQTILPICATCVIVFNVDADVATDAASTNRQRGRKDYSRVWRKTPPRINSQSRVVETTYKDIKIKAVMKLYYNPDPSMEAVRLFEENSVRGERHSVIKYARSYAEEFGIQLKLEYPEPVCVTDDGKEVNEMKVKGCIAKARQEDVQAKVKAVKRAGEDDL